jgi:hypothetical protein
VFLLCDAGLTGKIFDTQNNVYRTSYLKNDT